jgi:membrane-bound lytic murein transglycosylase F
LRRAVVLAAALAIASGLAVHFAQRPAPSLPPPAQAGELVVLVRPGPVVYFPGPDGALAGLDVELARKFATEKMLPLRFVLADTGAAVIAAVARGEAHIGAGGLFRPSGAAAIDGGSAAVAAPEAKPGRTPSTVSWTSGYASVEPLLIYNRDGYKPSDWRDLEGESVAYVDDDTGFEPEIAAARMAHPKIAWERLTLPTVGLISQVSDGTRGYAIVGSIAAAVARNIYLDFDVAFAAGGRREVAWVVAPGNGDLRRELDAFLARLARDGTLDRLIERYIPDIRQIQRIDAGVLQERLRTLLPRYRALFQDAQEHTGIEWRLLAAIAYQESQWDPAATSETGVRGFMQITEDTAKRLGITNLLDPAQNVLGAARYLRDIKDRLPARIAEPERTWLALAAFNIGLGHLEDARILAQRQKLNPDLWSDVKQVLPLLALPEYYAKAKQGYARGGMPVAFVDRVRGYYDVLLAREEAHQPRLRMFADTPEHGLAKLKREIVKK